MVGKQKLKELATKKLLLRNYKNNSSGRRKLISDGRSEIQLKKRSAKILVRKILVKSKQTLIA